MNVSSAASFDSTEVSLGPEVICPVASRLPERRPEGGRPAQTQTGDKDFLTAVSTLSTLKTLLGALVPTFHVTAKCLNLSD